MRLMHSARRREGKIANAPVSYPDSEREPTVLLNESERIELLRVERVYKPAC